VSDLRLVTTDVDPNSPEYGSIRAVAPGSATALPIPSFRIGASTPAAGTIVGEGFINSTTRSAMVWDGTQWAPIVAGALVVYPTDADVINDPNQVAGTYATSSATGNLFVKGAAAWRQIGVRTYTTVAGLLADNAPEGSLGVAIDEETFWVVHGGVWHCHSRRPVADVAALAAWASPPEGSTAMEQAEELRYHYHSGHWVPESIWIKTEADILASTDRLDGQMAVASDTGHVYVFHSGTWMSSQIQHYPTEADLLADTPNNGILAWADDNGLVYARFNGAWRRVNSPTVTVGTAAPGTPAAGDLFLDTGSGATSIYDGSNWVDVSSASVAVVSDTAPASPAAGALWLRTNRSGGSPNSLFVWNGSTWSQSGPLVTHGPANSRPNYNNSQYGEIFIDADTNRVEMSGPGKWETLNSVRHLKKIRTHGTGATLVSSGMDDYDYIEFDLVYLPEHDDSIPMLTFVDSQGYLEAAAGNQAGSRRMNYHWYRANGGGASDSGAYSQPWVWNTFNTGGHFIGLGSWKANCPVTIRGALFNHSDYQDMPAMCQVELRGTWTDNSPHFFTANIRLFPARNQRLTGFHFSGMQGKTAWIAGDVYGRY
jgi:hypothetical protein